MISPPANVAINSVVDKGQLSLVEIYFSFFLIYFYSILYYYYYEKSVVLLIFFIHSCFLLSMIHYYSF